VERSTSKSFSLCVLSGHPECLAGGQEINDTWINSYGAELQLSYFCGYRPGCSDPASRAALHRAKAAVEEQYSVVGAVERRAVSLAVMEAFLPRWFRGATALQRQTQRRRVMTTYCAQCSVF
jgi:hypothetical protein